MVTIEAGTIFLDAWNIENNKNYSAKEFFNKEYFPLILNHPKYIYWVINSSFVYPGKGKQINTLTDEDRLKLLNNFHEKIDNGYRDASIVVGMSASDEKEYQTTSGQITNINLNLTSEDVYLSWIGSTFTINVDSGYSILFLDKQILLDLFEGFKVYRRLLNDETIKMLPNKISNWNGQWLKFKYDSDDYCENPDFTSLTSCGFFKDSFKDKVLIGVTIETVNWARLYFNISQYIQKDTILSYVCYLFKTNTTIGFIPFHLNKGRYVLETYRKLFGNIVSIKERKDYEALFGRAFGIACEYGSIGLLALEPSSIKELFYPKNNKLTNVPEINYKIYKTWLTAMAETEENELDYIDNIAKTFIKIASNSKINQKNKLVEDLLLSDFKSKERFYVNLETLIKECTPDEVEIINDLKFVKYVNNIESYNFRNFLALLRLEYSMYKKLKK